MPLRVFSQFVVEFGDCDPAGIVFYPNFLRYMDAASMRYFEGAGVPPWHRRTCGDGIIGTPIVDVQVRFVSPATYGDRIDIETTITEWRNRSFVMQHVIRRGETLLVEGRDIRVFATRHPDDPGRIRVVAAPADIRARCEAA